MRLWAFLVLSLGGAAMAQEMVRVPAGPFTMGSDDGAADERPAHTVAVDAFEIDRLPVSNTAFSRFLQQHGALAPGGARYFDWDDPDARIHRHEGSWRADPGYGDHPVVEASWLGAHTYCRVIGKRLPTEAEWEKAARGTDGRRYPWGNAAPAPTHARFRAGFNETAPAGAHAAGASPYGALDMAGNVWHWVSSAYRPYPYRSDDGRDDPAPGPVRGTRGGGHDSSATELRTTERGRNLSRAPAAGHHNIGFRCAR
jgi:formylglycine-generating enzyme required for sulfatase activity